MTRSDARRVATRKPRNAHSKKTPKKVRNRTKTASKVAAKLRNNIAAETVRETYRKSNAPLDRFRGSQVPEALRVLAERNLAQTRELYEHSKSTLQTVLESWQKSFGAAGQNAISLNRKMIHVAERNMNMGFDLAIGLTGAKNLAEVMELHAVYWHKIASAVQTQTRPSRRNQ
jgi:hypothetical protein